MSEGFLNDRVHLHCGDCRDVLAGLSENSIDSCVTDPPYHLTSIVKRFGAENAAPAQFGSDGRYARASAGFMGKVWDGGDIAFDPDTWRAVYRVLKPGAHLLAMGGTRTYHRLACAIEDAGFEIRDCIQWLYGSGFPKSHDVSKGIDKRGGNSHLTREISTAIKAARESRGMSTSECDKIFCGSTTNWSWFEGRPIGQRAPNVETFALICAAWPELLPFANAVAEVEREVIGENNNVFRSYQSTSINYEINSGSADITAPATDAARQWAGFGTALKPACEMIVLARKPLSEGTVAANVLRWGTGAINVDGCRIHADDAQGGNYTVTRLKPGATLNKTGGNWRPENGGVEYNGEMKPGRWPANVIHDGSEEVVAAFPESDHARGNTSPTKCGGYAFWGSGSPNHYGPIDSGDSGSAARFFYTAKADSDERITRYVEDVRIEWNSENGLRQVTLLVDTEQSLEKVIVVSPSMADSGWSTFLCGSTITELFRRASKFIIRTTTSSTIESKTWNWLTTLRTRESIADVNYETANGGNHAENAGRGFWQITITVGRTESLPGAESVASGTPLKISVSGRQHSHPTVKPLALLQYLIRLICPKGGTVLDCFAGTGTLGEAAWREGMSAVLIEREAEYCADIRRRMALALSGPDERARESIKAKNLPVDDGPLFDWADNYEPDYDHAEALEKKERKFNDLLSEYE
jgi:DNA modification methylase